MGMAAAKGAQGVKVRCQRPQRQVQTPDRAHAWESSGFTQFSSIALRQIQVTKQNVSHRPIADFPSVFYGL